MSTDVHANRLRTPQQQQQQQRRHELQRQTCVRPSFTETLSSADDRPSYVDTWLTVVDVLLHVFVVSTLIIGIWRASYELIILVHTDFNSRFTFSASVIVQFLLSVMSDPLTKYFSKKNHSKVAFWVVSRAFIYARFVCGMFMYVYQEEFLEETLTQIHIAVSPYIVLIVAIIILCSIRKFGSIAGPPTCGYQYDPKPEIIFQLDRMFWPEDGMGSWLYVLDSFFSVCIIGSLVVIVWRGIWYLMDKILYPEDEYTSTILSLVIGYSVVLTAFALQPAIKKLVNKVNGIKRLFFVDVYLLFSFFGAVNVWRGVWNMLDNYFIPGAPITSYWVSHIACFGFLVLLNSSNSILVRGVYIDAEEDGTECVDFPCYYVRLLVQKRKRRKQRIQVEEEGKEMVQVKAGIEERLEDQNEKVLLTNKNGGLAITNDEEQEKSMLNNSGKIV